MVIVSSLIFVGLQLRQSEHAAQSDLSQNSVARGVEISTLIADHSDIWIKACAGQELRPHEQLIANNIYFRYLQDNFNSWSRSEITEIGFMHHLFLLMLMRRTSIGILDLGKWRYLGPAGPSAVSAWIVYRWRFDTGKKYSVV